MIHQGLPGEPHETGQVLASPRNAIDALRRCSSGPRRSRPDFAHRFLQPRFKLLKPMGQGPSSPRGTIQTPSDWRVAGASPVTTMSAVGGSLKAAVTEVRRSAAVRAA